MVTPASDNPGPANIQTAVSSVEAWCYVAPFAVFLIGTQLEAQATGANGELVPHRYALFYCLKILAVIVALMFSRGALKDLKPFPGRNLTAVSILLGAFIAFFWIGLDGLYPGLPDFMGGKRSAFDPYSLEPSWRYIFMAIRGLGLVLVVPVIEELFTRDFLLRFVTAPDWQPVPSWAFTPTAAAVSLGLFIMGHPEWLPALLCGLIWLGLLRWGKSVSALVISHCVANLGLGLYSLATGDWHFL